MHFNNLHIKSARQILKTLQEKTGVHPEIGAAITKLGIALNVLAIKTDRGLWRGFRAHPSTNREHISP
jgi:hypothetical protein